MGIMIEGTVVADTATMVEADTAIMIEGTVEADTVVLAIMAAFQISGAVFRISDAASEAASQGNSATLSGLSSDSLKFSVKMLLNLCRLIVMYWIKYDWRDQTLILAMSCIFINAFICFGNYDDSVKQQIQKALPLRLSIADEAVYECGFAS